MRERELKQNANEGCNSCASHAGLVLSFIACFILLVIAPLAYHVYFLRAPAWPGFFRSRMRGSDVRSPAENNMFRTVMKMLLKCYQHMHNYY